MGPKRMRYNDGVIGSARKYTMDVAVDRLSSLPDDVIHKIFSFISIKDAIGTSVLSSRWRFIWTSTPCLNFEKLKDGPHISKFISNVLSHRKNQIQVSSVNLVLGRSVRDEVSVRRIVKCAFSHNVQELTVITTHSPEDYMSGWTRYSFIATPKWDLPVLTTLHLHHIELSDYNNDNDKCIGLFSKCINLKNLSLRRCTMQGIAKVLNICHPRLANLTLEYMERGEVVNVVAPKLKNLTIFESEGRHLISAPGLTSLIVEGVKSWHLETPEGFHSLEKVHLSLWAIHNTSSYNILSLLQQLRSVKLLTLNLGILQRLCSQSKFLHGFSKAMVITEYIACAFINAKIIKFIPNRWANVHLEVWDQEKVTIASGEIKNYDTCPSAISLEEVTAMGDIESAENEVEIFRSLLKRCDQVNADKVHMDEYEPHWVWVLQLNLEKVIRVLLDNEIEELETCNAMDPIRRRYSWKRPEARPIIAWLQEMSALFDRIDRLITPLSASKRAVIQPYFLSVCKDAANLTNKFWEWMATAK